MRTHGLASTIALLSSCRLPVSILSAYAPLRAPCLMPFTVFPCPSSSRHPSNSSQLTCPPLPMGDFAFPLFFILSLGLCAFFAFRLSICPPLPRRGRGLHPQVHCDMPLPSIPSPAAALRRSNNVFRLLTLSDVLYSSHSSSEV